MNAIQIPSWLADVRGEIERAKSRPGVGGRLAAVARRIVLTEGRGAPQAEQRGQPDNAPVVGRNAAPLATPPATCRYLGQRVGTIDCGCAVPRVLYDCTHPEQVNQPAFCCSSMPRPGPRKATYDAGATDEIVPASCLGCGLREAAG